MDDFIKKINEYKVGHDRFNAVSELFNEHMDRKPIDKEISCKKGCSNCCTIPVHLTKSESIVIKDLANKHGVDIDRAKKQSQSKKWFQDLDVKDRKCVFLHHNVCSIYEFRPFYCRTFKVVSSPKFCNTKYNHKVKQKLNLFLEIIHNALINCEDETDIKQSRTISSTVAELPQ
jgi:Fe-S-cluster containining protein